jgi:hypothetical protein
MFTAVWGKNPLHPLVEFALTGAVSPDTITMTKEDVWLDGKTVGQVLPALRPGTIASIEGMDAIKAHPCVIAAFPRFAVGDIIKPTHNVNQRFCEIDLVCGSDEEMKAVADWIYETLVIRDKQGNNMVVSKFDTNRLLQRREIINQ